MGSRDRSVQQTRANDADRVVSRRSYRPGSRLRRGFDPTVRDAVASPRQRGRLPLDKGRNLIDMTVRN
jgi:hypothetical protein